MRSLAVALLLSVVACSGAEPTNLFGNADASVPQVDATASADTGVVDTGVPPKDAEPDVVTMKDAGPKSLVSCGSAGSCGVPDELCCRTGNFNPYQYACQSAKNDKCVGLAIPCDKASNCEALGFPGQVCCGHYVPQGMSAVVDEVECRPLNQCTQQQQSVILCDPKAPNACPIGSCQLSMTSIPGYYICR